MTSYPYRLVNVFTRGGALTGNPLCVFEDGSGLDDVTMQTVFSLHVYTDQHIKFGQRFADTIQTLPNGDLVLDLTQFHVTVPDHIPRDSVAA